jgi:ubiquinone/menaquinone biosynthesis C-methylase UbiE
VSYHPDLYDTVTSPSIGGDVEWYAQKALESGGPVLELGAGSGRVTLAIANAGIAIHALDRSDAMLARLAEKLKTQTPDVQNRVTLIAADMRTFALSQRFALIVIPYRAFLHNLTEGDRLACLDRVRGHLPPGGRFAFNVFHPSLEFMAQHAGPLAGVWRWAGTHPLASGGYVIRSEAIRYNTVRQIVNAQLRYDEYGVDNVLVRTALHPIELAYLYPNDIRRLLERAGFDDIVIKGNFAGRDFLRDTDELVVEAVSPGRSSNAGS